MSGAYVELPVAGTQINRFDVFWLERQPHQVTTERCTRQAKTFREVCLAVNFFNLGTWDTTGMTDAEASEALALIEEAVQ